jgi:hypothetical protein
MALAGMPPGRYALRDRSVDLSEDFAVWAPGKTHLIGGAMTMPQMREKLSEHITLSESQLGALFYDNAKRLVSQTLNAKVTPEAFRREPVVSS